MCILDNDPKTTVCSGHPQCLICDVVTVAGAAEGVGR